MGNVLIALDDEMEKKMRRIAREKYGGKKGAISQVVKEGIENLSDEEERKKAIKELRATMEKGYHLGTKGMAYKSRDELYD